MLYWLIMKYFISNGGVENKRIFQPLVKSEGQQIKELQSNIPGREPQLDGATNKLSYLAIVMWTDIMCMMLAGFFSYHNHALIWMCLYESMFIVLKKNGWGELSPNEQFQVHVVFIDAWSFLFCSHFFSYKWKKWNKI